MKYGIKFSLFKQIPEGVMAPYLPLAGALGWILII